MKAQYSCIFLRTCCSLRKGSEFKLEGGGGVYEMAYLNCTLAVSSNQHIRLLGGRKTKRRALETEEDFLQGS